MNHIDTVFKYLRHVIVGLLMLVMMPLSLQADIKQSALKEGMGVRALSMGNAFTALAEGELAMIYNPAGLAVPGNLYSFQNIDFNSTVYKRNQMHAYYSAPIGYSYWTQKNQQSESLDVHAFGYARRGSNGIDWGMTYKVVQHHTPTSLESGWSSDLGLMIHTFPFMNIGLVAQDIFKQNIAIPAAYKAGIAVFSPMRRLNVATDIVYKNTNGTVSYDGHYGVEYHIAEGLVLRSGWYDNNITGGVNFVWPFFEMEYGFVSPQVEGQEARMMLGFKLGPGLESHKFKKRYSIFKPNSYAEFTLGRNLTSGKSEISLFGGFKMGSNDLLTMIRHAADDSTCDGFIIRLQNFGGSLGSIGLIQELRKELFEAKGKGKKIYVYIENWVSLPEYYLATVADQILMPELGSMSHLGLELQVSKTRKFLESFGLEKKIISSGSFKDSLHPTSPKLSMAERHQLENLLNDIYTRVIAEIKLSRDLDWETVKEVFDGRIITAQYALKHGLVDYLGYFEAMEPIIMGPPTIGVASRKLQKHRLTEFNVNANPSVFSRLNRIAVIKIDGPIKMGKNSSNFLFGGKATGSEEIEELVGKIEKDFTIRGVIIRVNSPGGSMIASDQIYNSIQSLRAKGKLVYVSMGNIAASGGYYVALNSDKIMANHSTLTGSIGVISSYFNFAGLSDTLGIESETIKTGEYADMGSSNRKMTEREEAMLKQNQDLYYQAFLAKVKKHRGLNQAELSDVAQGQVFTGSQAAKLGLIDEVGGFSDTVSLIAKDLDISDPQLVFVRSKPEFAIPFLQSGFMGKMLGKYLQLGKLR